VAFFLWYSTGFHSVIFNFWFVVEVLFLTFFEFVFAFFTYIYHEFIT